MEKKFLDKESKNYKIIQLTRLIFSIWILFIIFLVITNSDFPYYFLHVPLMAGPQMLLLFCSFYSLKICGILLLVDSLIIGMVTLPLISYGIGALIQCMVFLAAPPLLFGVVFLACNNSRVIISENNK